LNDLRAATATVACALTGLLGGAWVPSWFLSTVRSAGIALWAKWCSART